MNELEFKFEQNQQKWNAELAKNEQKINSKKFDAEDMKQMRVLRGT